ncbi:aldo/keto reductase [Glycomyces sp. A-F 0318]|uniref:aldo/keto reductase n=1 Tax=Glycomyces amatae TaxID=2881355 RepID=UPI001E326518|nr:aldo/keto reductase [Glycomyces amatae]MCD0442023.1 aldo/keto reductase [Glycomyces amatae]
MAPVAPTVELAHGAAMPRLGLGTWPMDDAESERVVAEAVGLGYRLVDTAENYGNERGVGLGLKASGVDREDLFVTTKFNREWHGVDLAAEACQRSLDKLGLDYLDLLLIHWPNPQHGHYVEAFQGLVRLLETGRVKAVGTSNFKPSHLDRIIEATGVIPDVNQIQLSPLTTRLEPRAYHKERGIVTQSWSPIGGEGGSVREDPLVLELAEKYGKTPVQVVLRWHLDLGLAVIPKSSNAERLEQNLDVFDFSLDPDDVMALSALDQGEAAAADSDEFGH